MIENRKTKERHKMRDGFYGALLFMSFFVFSSFVHAAEGEYEFGRFEDQCYAYKSVDSVGDLFFYALEDTIEVVVAFDRSVAVDEEGDLASFIKADGFADYFDLALYDEKEVSFSAPLSYFKENVNNLQSLFYYIGERKYLIPVGSLVDAYVHLSNCEQEDVIAVEAKNPVFFSEEEKVIAVEPNEYDFSSLPVQENADTVLEYEQSLEYVEEQPVQQSLMLEDQDVPFVEEVQRHLQKNIFIPVESRVSSTQFSLDEQLEVIDSLTEKIKLLELEKELLRKQVSGDGQSIINLLAEGKKVR